MKTVLWVLTALLMAALCAPAMAQTFTDVPTDHWAYRAVQELADRGLIIGYPDGTFGGKRALTRYEFAMAISRMLPILRQIVREEIGTPTTGISREEFNNLERRVSELERRPTTQPEVTRQDLENIRRLIDEFRDELATLGVDVDTLKRDVADLRARMEAVEETLRRMPRISADSNIYFRGSSTRSGREPAIDLDGRTLDPDTRILEGVAGLYDMDLRIEGRVSDTITAHALINGGNYVNWLNDQLLGVFALTPEFDQNAGVSTPPYIAGFPFAPTEAADQVRIWHLYADTPISLGPLRGMDFTVGKFPYQLTPYFLRMPDVDSYFYNYKTDSGDYPMLGGALNTKLGPVGLNLFASKQRDSLVPFVGGFAVPMGISQTAGARINFGLPFLGNIGVNYLRSGLDNRPINAEIADEYAWWGADLGTTLFNNIGLTATWAQSQPQEGNSRIAGFGDRNAVDARLTIPLGRLSIGGGYRKIDPNYSAPGYWGKIGYIINPVDIEGAIATLSIPVFNRVTFNASGEWYHGLSEPYNLGLAPVGIPVVPGVNIPVFDSGDKIRRYVAGFRFDLTSTNRVDLGIEHVRFRPEGFDVTRQTWISVGLGHSFNPNASFKFMYQFIDLNNRSGQPFWGPVDGQGGVAVSQFSFRF